MLFVGLHEQNDSGGGLVRRLEVRRGWRRLDKEERLGLTQGDWEGREVGLTRVGVPVLLSVLVVKG